MNLIEPPNFSPDVLVAIDAVTKAAEEVKRIYGSDFSSALNDGQPITEADTGSNEVIKKILATTGYTILSEESVDDLSRLAQQKIWIVDPLDGTSDFVNKTGEFVVMIGLVNNHLPVAGVLYQPIGDILYVAEKDRGAYRYQSGSWEKLFVSQVTKLSDARVTMSRHHLSTEDKLFLDQLGVDHYIQQGSCGLKVASIAQAEAEFYFTSTSKIKQWDTCAANCLVTEAGGTMTDMLGQPLTYNTAVVNHEHGILVSNGNFTAQLVALRN